MKRFIPFMSALIASVGVAAAGPWTLVQVIDSLSSRYDRIDSYRADADIFEYDG